MTKQLYTLHWLVGISYVTLFFGTIIPILIANKPESVSISECVQDGVPRIIFTSVVACNVPILIIILYAFLQWRLHVMEQDPKRLHTFIVYLQFILGVLGIMAFLSLAIFTLNEHKDVHLMSAKLFFGFMYVHLLISVVVSYAYVNTMDDGQDQKHSSGWHVLRLCSPLSGTLIIIGTYYSMVNDKWVFSNFEWLYMSTLSTYLFTFWNEMCNQAFTPCCPMFLKGD